MDTTTGRRSLGGSTSSAPLGNFAINTVSSFTRKRKREIVRSRSRERASLATSVAVPVRAERKASLLPRPYSAGSQGPVTRSQRVLGETHQTTINMRKRSNSTDSHHKIESDSELEEINARPEVYGRDHVNYDAGQREQASHHSNQRLDTSQRLECTEHPPDPQGPRDGEPPVAAARTLHHDDRALGELRGRNPIVYDHHPRDREMQGQLRSEVGDSLRDAAEHSHRVLEDTCQDDRATNELGGRLSSEPTLSHMRTDHPSLQGSGIRSRSAQLRHDDDIRASHNSALSREMPTHRVADNTRSSSLSDPEFGGVGSQDVSNRLPSGLGVPSRPSDPVGNHTQSVRAERTAGPSQALALVEKAGAAISLPGDHSSGSPGGRTRLQQERAVSKPGRDELTVTPVIGQRQAQLRGQNSEWETWHTDDGGPSQFSPQDTDLARAKHTTVSQERVLKPTKALNVGAAVGDGSIPVSSYWH